MKPTEYIAGNRRGRAAHDLELEAMRDPLLAEALEGFEATPGNHADAVARLQKRLAARTARRRLWPRLAIAAALLAAVATTALLTLHRPEEPTDFPAVAVTTPPAVEPAEATPNALVQADKLTTAQPTGAVKQPASAPQTSAVSPHGAFEPDRTECWEETEEPGPQAVDINDVVVIAYGNSDKKAITGAVGRQPGAEKQATDELLKGIPPAKVNGKGSTMTEEDLFIPDGPALVDEVIPADQPFLNVETMPSFEGGDLHTFRQWVDKRVRKPNTALASGPVGRVVVAFVIDTTGKLGNVQVLQSPDRSLADEAVRVIESSPLWEPGKQRDRKVRVRMTMPVDFRQQN